MGTSVPLIRGGTFYFEHLITSTSTLPILKYSYKEIPFNKGKSLFILHQDLVSGVYGFHLKTYFGAHGELEKIGLDCHGFGSAVSSIYSILLTFDALNEFK